MSEYKELVTKAVTKAVVESCYMALTDCGCPDNRDIFVKVVKKQLGISSEEAENYFEEIRETGAFGKKGRAVRLVVFLEKDGILTNLPFAVGDIAYVPKNGEILEYEITGIELTNDDGIFYQWKNLYNKNIFLHYNYTGTDGFRERAVNEYVFKTRDEALSKMV
jgi:hypothetical protein